VPEMDRPLTQGETRRVQEGQSKGAIAKERFWRMRPDGTAVLPPVVSQDFCTPDLLLVKFLQEQSGQFGRLRAT
jgi:hypothetical protein